MSAFPQSRIDNLNEQYRTAIVGLAEAVRISLVIPYCNRLNVKFLSNNLWWRFQNKIGESHYPEGWMEEIMETYTHIGRLGIHVKEYTPAPLRR